MRLLFKTLLIWIVMLAIPAQGMAASTMLLCGPSHHRMQQALSETEHDAHEHPAPEAMEASQHEHASSQADTSPHDAKQGGQLAELGKYKCSACASCCSAAAILQAFPVVATVATVTQAFVSPLSSVFAFVTDGPDRPPRPLFA